MKNTIIISAIILLAFTVGSATAQTSLADRQVELCREWIASYSTATISPTARPTMTASPTVTLTPTTKPSLTVAPPSGYLFNADFETGNLSYFDKTRGEVFGKGTNYKAYVVPMPAIGNYAAALQIGSGSSTAMYLFTYNSTVPPSGLGTYAADYYIPAVITPGGWWSVWQWKSVDNTYNKPIITLNLIKRNNILQLVMFYTPGGINTNPTQTVYQTAPLAFPVDKWVNVSGDYFQTATNTGYVTVYQDGVKVFEKSGILTRPGNKNVLWSVHSYADSISPNPATIYVDNMRITGK
jgi:hypothetical protein